MILVFDTETTGKADFNAPIEASHQPHIVQIGAQLLDDQYTVRGEINLIVKPNGWTIPEEVSRVHGITTEIAETFGFELEHVAEQFGRMVSRSHVLVAHNFSFDSLLIHAEWHRLAYNDPPFEDDQVKFCTMHESTDIVRIPGKYGDYKWPSLQEAHQFAFGEKFEGAHDAMADVRACARLYKWLKTREVTV
jgi:DNA polymerase III epsilon subunit-like protein